ncbi:MAG: U32 family peptidase [Methanobacterium sp.]|nr:U32 family peptidase [Methanobacterium sp.]
MSLINIPELLAPAGSIESLKAAVNAGADAVYISGKRFGARQFARNFSQGEMEDAIEYAHLRGVKVYVTVNTLVNESELQLVARNLLEIYSSGADAIIVQDLGVAQLAKKIVPQLNLHCSTQMTIHNPQGVNWAAENGFKRVVLAREMVVEDIEKTARQLPGEIELEVFAHGAICYSYSGQCFLSSFIGGRSGNRGRCAQPCRKKYQLITGKTDNYGKYQEGDEIPLKNHYLLSTRDLAIYSHLDRISDAPVDSIKIEGRMRPPEYVANVVKVYRDALDSVAQGQWKVREEDVSKLKMSFNRGTTRGWLLGASYQAMMGRGNPGNRGLYLGKVVNYDKHNAWTIVKNISRVNPEKGDGILFKQPDNGGKSENLWGTILEHSPKIKKNHISLKLRKKIEVGSSVYITRRKSLIEWANHLMSDPQLPHPIPLDLQIDWNKEKVPIIMVTASPPWQDNNIEIEFEADFAMEKAIKRPLSMETITKQLKKTGGTPFIIRKISLNYPGDLFTPLGNLNRLRRQILQKIQNKILKTKKPSANEIEFARTQFSMLTDELNLVESVIEDSTWKKDELKKEPIDLKKWPISMKNESMAMKKDSTITLKDDPLINQENSAEKIYRSINLAIYVDGIPSVEAALQAGCRRIYFQPKLGLIAKDRFSLACLKHKQNYDAYFKQIDLLIRRATTLCQDYGSDLVWKWPDITSRMFISGAMDLLNNLPQKSLSGVMLGGTDALWALENNSYPLNLHGSGSLNIWNHLSAEQLLSSLKSSLKSITLSPELSQSELKKVALSTRDSLPHCELEFLVQGNLEALVSEDCLLQVIGDMPVEKYNDPHQFLGIKDLKSRIFPVEIDEECRTHIANSVELCLLDHLPSLHEMGLSQLVIDSRNKPADYALTMFTTYQKALELTSNQVPHLRKKLNSLKNQVKKVSNGGITSGNFLRGLNNDY